MTSLETENELLRQHVRYLEQREREVEERNLELQRELEDNSRKLQRLAVYERAHSTFFPFFLSLPKTFQLEVAEALLEPDRRSLSQTNSYLRDLLWNKESPRLECRIETPIVLSLHRRGLIQVTKGRIPNTVMNTFSTNGPTISSEFSSFLDHIKVDFCITRVMIVMTELNDDWLTIIRFVQSRFPICISFPWELHCGNASKMLSFVLDECTDARLILRKLKDLAYMESLVKERSSRTHQLQTDTFKPILSFACEVLVRMDGHRKRVLIARTPAEAHYAMTINLTQLFYMQCFH